MTVLLAWQRPGRRSQVWTSTKFSPTQPKVWSIRDILTETLCVSVLDPANSGWLSLLFNLRRACSSVPPQGRAWSALSNCANPQEWRVDLWRMHQWPGPDRHHLRPARIHWWHYCLPSGSCLTLGIGYVEGDDNGEYVDNDDKDDVIDGFVPGRGLLWSSHWPPNMYWGEECVLMMMMKRHTVDDRRSLTVEICPEVEKVKITTFLTICLFLSYFLGIYVDHIWSWWSSSGHCGSDASGFACSCLGPHRPGAWSDLISYHHHYDRQASLSDQ